MDLREYMKDVHVPEEEFYVSLPEAPVKRLSHEEMLVVDLAIWGVRYMRLVSCHVMTCVPYCHSAYQCSVMVVGMCMSTIREIGFLSISAHTHTHTHT